MKKYFNRLKKAEGWAKFKDLCILLVVFLFITTIGQLFFEKDVKFTEVLNNIISGEYNFKQFRVYGLYVISKMIVIALPTIGAAFVLRFIIHKDSLSNKFQKLRSTAWIVLCIIVWLVILMVFFSWKLIIEEEYLNSNLSILQGLFQLYEYVLPALTLTFIDYTYSEIRDAKKVEKGEKLAGDVEKEIVNIFSDERLTDGDKKLMLNNLKAQAKKRVENR